MQYNHSNSNSSNYKFLPLKILISPRKYNRLRSSSPKKYLCPNSSKKYNRSRPNVQPLTSRLVNWLALQDRLVRLVKPLRSRLVNWLLLQSKLVKAVQPLTSKFVNELSEQYKLKAVQPLTSKSKLVNWLLLQFNLVKAVQPLTSKSKLVNWL